MASSKFCFTTDLRFLMDTNIKSRFCINLLINWINRDETFWLRIFHFLFCLCIQKDCYDWCWINEWEAYGKLNTISMPVFIGNAHNFWMWLIPQNSIQFLHNSHLMLLADCLSSASTQFMLLIPKQNLSCYVCDFFLSLWPT